MPADRTARTEKRCPKCKAVRPVADYYRNRSSSDGYSMRCKSCTNAAQAVRDAAKGERNDARYAAEDARVIREAEERARRIASDHEALRVDDFDDPSENVDEDYDVGIANDAGSKRLSARASREKRQEFSRGMGQFSDELTAAARASANGQPIEDGMSAASGAYIGKLAEQERRFGNRRLARSVSLAEAHEALAIRNFKIAARQYLSDKVTPTGYARKKTDAAAKRTVCLLLSDLHLGSDLSSLDEPVPFRAVEEARRLEFVLRQVLDYKPQYRGKSDLLLFLNGDMIEGQLGHDLRGGAPLTEQKVIFWKYFRAFVGHCAQQYPRVRVVCQPGNHGRDKVRHPGRATSRKWDGHEWELYWALQQMCSGLRNVEWQVDLRAVSIVDVHGATFGATHGDTEVKLGHPDAASSKNAASLDRINAARVFGVEFDAWVIGHFHTPRFHPRHPAVIYNGALVPPNGYARAEGHVAESCGQWMFEATEGFPIGDLRFIRVGREQDEDENLGSLIQPFRFEE